MKTGGNSSAIVDGAAAALVLLRLWNLKPETALARIVAGAAVGAPPDVMGIGPVPAIRRCRGP